ncbi:MAG: hypothetical protein AAF602_08000, partial [Myxococcota bacterium]
FDVAGLGRRRAVWVALQVAYLGAARAHGGAPPGLPCLRAAQTQPGRTAAHARRLFAEGDVPDAVVRFLGDLAREPGADVTRLRVLRDRRLVSYWDA